MKNIALSNIRLSRNIIVIFKTNVLNYKFYYIFYNIKLKDFVSEYGIEGVFAAVFISLSSAI